MKYAIADIKNGRTRYWSGAIADDPAAALRKHFERLRPSESSHHSRLQEEGAVRFAVAKCSDQTAHLRPGVELIGMRFFDVTLGGVQIQEAS